MPDVHGMAEGVESVFASTGVQVENLIADASQQSEVMAADLVAATAGTTNEHALRMRGHLDVVAYHLGMAAAALAAAGQEKDGLLADWQAGAGAPGAVAALVTAAAPTASVAEHEQRYGDLEMVPVTGNRPALMPSGLPMELDAVANARRTEYIAAAADYTVARDDALRSVAGGAMLVQQSTAGDNGSHEVVSWRIDGDVTDGEYDYATRVRLVVTPADAVQSPPQDALVPEPVELHRVTPEGLQAKAPVLGKGGVYVQGIEYRKVPLEDITAEGSFARMSHTRIFHGGRVYAADHKTGDVVAFPGMTDYDTLVKNAYTEHAGATAAMLPESADLADRLAAAAATDSKGATPTDDLAGYQQRLQELPSGMEERIRQLTEGLYEFGASRSDALPPKLAAALMDPYVAEVAELALKSQWSYRKHQGGRNYSAPLTAQLTQIRQFGRAYQQRLFAAIENDAAGFERCVRVQIQGISAQTQQAQAFASHVSGIETMPMTGKDWEVRAR